MKVYQYVVVNRPEKARPSIVASDFVLAKDEQGAVLAVAQEEDLSAFNLDELEVVIRPF